MKRHPPSKEELNGMRQAGRTRIDIAQAYDVSLYVVKRWIADLGIEERHTKAAERIARPPRDGQDKKRYASLDDGETLMEKAAVLLGKRLGEDHRGYILDGRPSNTAAILRAAHLSLKTAA